MNTAVHLEEVTAAVQMLIDQQQFPAAGLTNGATSFIANSLTNLQTFLVGLDNIQLSQLNWGLANEIAGNLRSDIFSGSLSPGRGEVINNLLQETLLKLPYQRDDDNRRIRQPIPLFSVYDLWSKFGGLLDWLNYHPMDGAGPVPYRSGIPVTIRNDLYFFPGRTDNTITIVIGEDICGGILKFINLAYPSGQSKLQVSVFGIPIDLNELRSHSGSRGNQFHIVFSDSSSTHCNNGMFLQGFISAALALRLEWSAYITVIHDKLGRECEVILQ